MYYQFKEQYMTSYFMYLCNTKLYIFICFVELCLLMLGNRITISDQKWMKISSSMGCFFVCFLKCAISSFLLSASIFALLICKCCLKVRILSFYLTHRLWIFLSFKFVKTPLCFYFHLCCFVDLRILCSHIFWCLISMPRKIFWFLTQDWKTISF